MRIVHRWLGRAACKCLGMALVVSPVGFSSARGGAGSRRRGRARFHGQLLEPAHRRCLTDQRQVAPIHSLPAGNVFIPAGILPAHSDRCTSYDVLRPGSLVDVMRHHFLPSGRMWRCSAMAAILGLVLIAEILALGLRFDASTLSIRGRSAALIESARQEATGNRSVAPIIGLRSNGSCRNGPGLSDVSRCWR